MRQIKNISIVVAGGPVGAILYKHLFKDYKVNLIDILSLDEVIESNNNLNILQPSCNDFLKKK